ncbi:MAG: Gfo/Idh/MocA family oxidoreductase [Phycisphaerae bacterium]|nr:Gfo/Idh/MocA family oxidoreductase [Phycisphaerae bacterium]
MPSCPIRRRTFVRCVAIAGATPPAFAPALVRAASPNAKLRFAGIGCNGQGWSDISQIATSPNVHMVAFCDVDERRFDRVAKRWPQAPRFRDWRKMFDRHEKDIDAVNVSIPDHMHAYVALDAMRRGKHVYCEKPLTHTVWEARQMAKVAEATGLTTRMGNQIHSRIVYRLGVRLIRDGAIGKVKAVHSWVNAHGHGRARRTTAPSQGRPVPAALNWDTWLGVAPARPYAEQLYHPVNWRDWQAFGSGAIGDFGCHILDPVFTALELTAPVSLSSEHTGLVGEVWPKSETIRYVFPGTPFTADKSIHVTWYDGRRQPPLSLGKMPEGTKYPGSGSLFVGTEGNLVLPHFAAPRLYPQEKYKGHKYPKLEPKHHWVDWVEAARAGKQVSDNFQYAGPLTETVQLGNVAARFPGKELLWDPAGFQITNAAKANAYLTREYRRGWEIDRLLA